MRTSGDFHKDLERDLKDPMFAVHFKKEKERLRLADRLKTAMTRSHLSIRKVASLMGTSKSQVERIISDPEANIGLDTLIKFASVVGKRVDITLR
ncbi:MAG: helix-turn-helix transcriptional regulator [Deltaproteobacteria bacterium]|nr:helix-turn-helix transcriptional regulator [Deltaproteobacteria bacterium]